MTFNGTTATTTSWSDTSITATVPAGATTGNMVVTVGGVASNGRSFAVTEAVVAGVMVTPTVLKVDEGGRVTYTVMLASQPLAHVTVNLTVSDVVAVSATPSSLTFTSLNWETGQQVAITAPEDDGDLMDETVSITHAVMSLDTNYSGLTVDGVSVTVLDNDVVRPPQIESINPPWSEVGAPVIISGWNFGASQGARRVTFTTGGEPATASVRYWSDTNIHVFVPSGSRTGNVVVTGGHEGSSEAPFTVINPNRPVLRGGSNYAWFTFDNSFDDSRRHECFSAIKHYHIPAVRTKVKKDLAVMWAKGQRRLRLPISHTTGTRTRGGCFYEGNRLFGGVLHNDSKGRLDDTALGTDVNQKENLQHFLTDVAGQGFEVMIGFFPQYVANKPFLWTEWDEDKYLANRNFIFNLREEVFDEIPNFKYVIDLHNEGAPSPHDINSARVTEYVKRLWKDYNSCATHQLCDWPPYSKTIGFSAHAADRLRNLIAIYDAVADETQNRIRRPYIYSFHTYDDTEGTPFRKYVDMSRVLAQAGVDAQVGAIIGEAHYNDMDTGSGLWTAMHFARRIRFLFQWPLEKSTGNWESPLEFCNYITQLERVTCPPFIDILNPTSGVLGTSVTITGTSFGTSGSVTFNGATASTSSWRDTQIVATVPSGATTGPVVVTVGTQASNGVDFTVTTPSEPTITRLDPTSGAVGTRVTISGINFGSSGSVTFNGTTASTSSWRDTQVVATVPSGATTGDVVVTVGTQASNRVRFTVTGATITATPNPCTITSVDDVDCSTTIRWNSVPPTTAVQIWVSHNGDPQTAFTGAGTTSGSRMPSWIQGSPHTYTFNLYDLSRGNSDPSTPPPGDPLASVVVTANGAPAGFIWANPDPCQIPQGSDSCTTEVVWTSRGYSAVRVWVSHDGATPVAFTTTDSLWGTKNATIRNSSTFYVHDYSSGSKGPSLKSVTVIATPPAAMPAPEITRLVPSSGQVGDTVEIRGSNFGATQVIDGQTSTVTFNGTSASATTWSATRIRATVPEGATTGNVVVTVKEQASNGRRFSVDHDAPTCEISATEPHIQTGGTSTLEWTSENATRLVLNPGNLDVTNDSNRSHDVRLNGAGAQKYTLTVTGPGGSGNCSVRVTAWDAPTASISPTKPHIRPNGTSTLEWESGSASSVTITDIGAVTPNEEGSRSVSLSATKTYTIEATNPAVPAYPAATGSVTVTVWAAPTASIDADPKTINRGGSSTLEWESANASSVTITGIGAVTPNEDGSRRVTLNATKTYTIEATNPAMPAYSAATASVTVTVPITGSISASPNPCTIASGKTTCTTTIRWSSTNTTAVQVWVTHTRGSTTTTTAFTGSNTTSGSQSASWIQLSPAHSYTFSLYDLSNGNPDTTTPPPGSALASVSVTGKRAPPGPVISSISPTQGETDTRVTISGANFGTTEDTVDFGTQSATIESWGSSSIVALVPLHLPTGQVTVTVTANSQTSNGVTFNVTGNPFNRERDEAECEDPENCPENDDKEGASPPDP